MALKLRLARGGSKKRPYYHIVVADVRAPRDGRFIEKIGSYNPMLPKDSTQRVRLIEERVKYWLGNGAKPTDRVHRFLDAAGLLKRDARNNPKKALPGKKAQERLEEKRQAEEDAKQASLEAEQAAKTEAEAPAEQASQEDAAKTEAEAPAEQASQEETAAE